jgi:ubiquitin-protein ligase
MAFLPGQLYHPNVSKDSGELCGDRIAEAFGPTKNSSDLAKLVVQFMETPNLESPLEADIAKEMRESIDKYEAAARKAAAAAPKKA